MLRVALISSPLTLEERYGKFSGAANTQPTFALACLAAIAEKEGVDVCIIDAAAECLSVEQTLREITACQPNIVGISSTTAGIVASGELARQIKNVIPKTITIIGGCHVTAIPEETLSEFGAFDLAVIGEGEITFREILKEVQETGGLPTNIAGTAIIKDGRFLINGKRSLIENLDTLPLPSWKRLRGFPENFRPSPARMKRFPCASVVLTRGCPNQCHFCDRSVFGNKVRSYSPAYAVNMIKDLAHNYGIREILIEDDTFVISRKRVKEFCERLIDEKVDITWSCLGRADRVTLEILKLMKRAGCWHISYGIESGDQKILDAMQKGEDLNQIAEAVRWSRQAGLKTKGFFMVGFPGETENSIKLTKELILRLPLDDISIMQLTPFPGTAIYSNAAKYGTFECDWRKMNVLNTVFIPDGFTKQEIETARAEMLKAFYFRPSLILKKVMDIFSNPRLLLYMVKGFFSLLKVVKKQT
ncbi:MAG: B12-binding domain-containing radical SAM protein [Syntrophales bacterium]